MVLAEFLKEWHNDSDEVLVHTSGSTGMPKPLWVKKSRMEASARVTCDFLGLHEGDSALLCMPLDFIAGKMVVVRSIVRKLKLISVTPSGHPLRTLIDEAGCKSEWQRLSFAAMVPMQVYNSLQVADEREMLRSIKHLIIGGGAIDDALAAQLKSFPNAVWSTYGMTETLSHIALRRMNGSEASQWYTPFNTVNVSLNDDGCLVIDAKDICEHTLTTNDRAVLAEDSRRFRIIGRKDNVICSGGIKIQIEEVETMLRPHLAFPYMINIPKRQQVR
jgi:O-succinylbenzoic acid--CoA ligase